MLYAVALSALAAATLVSAQAPDGCSSDFSGYFEYSPVPITEPLTQYALGTCASTPITTLKSGVLTDQCLRTGSIVANYQFQYDCHVQNNALNTNGFSVCSNNTLAVAGSALFYKCLSGTFYNLYDQAITDSPPLPAQCTPVYLQIIPCTPPADDTSSCPTGTAACTPTTASSTSSSSATSTSSSSSSTTPVITSAPVASSAAAPPPALVYAASNTTSTSATATGVAGTTVSPTTSPIASFHGGAAGLALGGKLLVSAVGIAALAFLA